MSEPSCKPRLAVVTTEIGIRSEVWILRQLAAFTRVEPVLFGWSVAPDPVPLPDGLETRLFHKGDTRRPGRVARVARRLGLASGYLPDAATRADIRNRLEAARIDAVLCHFAWNAIPVASSVHGRFPVVAQVHGRDVSALLASPAYRRALARTLPKLDFVAAVGSFQLERLKPLHLPPAHEVIPCGAPTALFGTGPLPERQPGEPIRFVSVGRMSPEKGVLQTLAAFEAVLARHPAAELLFVGQGPAEAELDSAIAASPAGHAVQRTGYLGPAALAELLARCHVLVQHSREVGGWIEGFGVMLTEGGAAGLPLVASRFGGIPDQVTDGRNGLLFPPNDIAAQANAMHQLAEDEPLRRTMGAEARRIAAGFDSTQLATRLEDRILSTIRA